MAKLEITLDREDGRYTAGEAVSGKAALTLDKQTKYRKIVAGLRGEERTSITTGSGKSRHTSTEANTITEQETILREEAGKKEGLLPPGVYEFPLMFVLPPGLLPTYQGDNAEISYELKVWVDVPLWFDLKGSKEISVIQKPQDMPQSAPISFSSKTLNTQKPSFSVSIENPVLQAGQTLQGKITVFNPQSSGLRKAKIKAYAMERAKAQYAKSVSDIFAAECEISPKELAYGAPKEFSIQIPPDAPKTYASKLSSLEWAVEASLDLPLRSDVKAAGAMTVA